MAGVVGVAAAAAQVATVCVTILDLMKKIKGGSLALKNYQNQFNELKTISESISTNPLLQTSEVGHHTQLILSIINNNCLSSLLQQGRFLRTLGFIHKEKDLIEIFTTLEHHKSSLSLLIEDVQARALYQIQRDIRVMANIPATHTTDVAKDNNLGESGINSSGTLIQSNALFHQSHGSGPHMSPGGPSAGVPFSQDHQQTSSRIPLNWTANRYWKNCKAENNCDQTNGIFIEGDSINLQDLQTYSVGNAQIFDGCITVGGGLQVNGIKIKTTGNSGPLRLPVPNSFWIDCSSKDEGHQVNGSGFIFGNKEQR